MKNAPCQCHGDGPQTWFDPAPWIARNRRKFHNWARRYAPEVFAVNPRLSASLSGLGDAAADSNPNEPQWIHALKIAADAYMNDATRRDLFKLNAERAAQGLPPLDPNGQEATGIAVTSPVITQALTVGGILLAFYFITGAVSPRRKRR